MTASIRFLYGSAADIADYHARRALQAIADYHDRSVEPPPFWLGDGAQALGLTGEADRQKLREQLTNVLEGKTPDGAQWLRGKERKAPAYKEFDARLDDRNTFAAVKRAAREAGRGFYSQSVGFRFVGSKEDAQKFAAQAARILALHDERKHGVPASEAPQTLDVEEAKSQAGRTTYVVKLRRAPQPLRAVDITENPDKTFSAAVAVAGPQERQRLLDDAVESMKEAHNWLFDTVPLARFGKGGREHIHGKVTSIAFPELTNRDHKPHVHIHNIIAADILRPDGTYGKVNTKKLAQWTHTVGAMFRAQLAAKLIARGYKLEFNPDRHGNKSSWRIVGVPDDLCKEWSRTDQLDEFLKESGHDPSEASSKLRNVAALHTRAESRDLPPEDELFGGWQAKGNEHSFTAEALDALRSNAPAKKPDFDALYQEVKKQALEQITTQNATFKERWLLQKMLQLGAPSGLDGLEVAKRLSHDLEHDRDFLRLGTVDHEEEYTTRATWRREKQLLATVERLRSNRGVVVTDNNLVEEKIRSYGLTDEQAEQLRNVLLGQKGAIRTLSGGAGVGKTHLLRAAKEILEQSGSGPVIGAALAGVASDKLEESNIASRTIASYLYHLEKPISQRLARIFRHRIQGMANEGMRGPLGTGVATLLAPSMLALWSAEKLVRKIANAPEQKKKDARTLSQRATDFAKSRARGMVDYAMSNSAGAPLAAVAVGPALLTYWSVKKLWSRNGNSFSERRQKQALSERAKNVAKDRVKGFLNHPLAAATKNLPPKEPRVQIPKNAVIFVDEAGMIDTKTMARLVRHVRRANATIVFLGDPKQLPPIEAGGPFARIIKSQKHHAHLTTNLRQAAAPEDRDAAALIREGETLAALESYAERGALIMEKDKTSTIKKLVATWVQKGGADDPKENFVFTETRKEAHLINRLCQGERQSRGIVGFRGVEYRDQTIARNDRIIFRTTLRKYGVKNGYGATVLSADFVKNRIKVQLDRAPSKEAKARGATRTFYLSMRDLPEGDDPAISLYYAGTTHRLQGGTVDTTLALLGRNKEMLYTQATRGRKTTTFFIDEQSAGDDLEALARAIARSSAKVMAHDVAEQAIAPQSHTLSR